MKNLIFVATTNKRTLKNSNVKDRLDYYSALFDKVYIFCMGLKEREEIGKFVYISGSFRDWFKEMKKLNDVAYVKTPDFFVAGVIAVWMAKYHKAPLVMRCGSPWLYTIDSASKLFKSILAKFTKPYVIKRCKKVVYNSKAVVQSQYKQDYAVVYNGVDTELFKPMKVSGVSKKFSILFIGRIWREKGIEFLFEGLEQIKDKIHLKLIGQGPLYDTYSKKYNWAEWCDHVPHNELAKVINQYDCFILPTFIESFPNVLLEAMSCGKAVIGTSVWGIPEMITDGKDGLLIPEKNADAIREVVLKLMDSPKLVEMLGNNARKTVLKRFEKDKQLKKLSQELFY